VGCDSLLVLWYNCTYVVRANPRCGVSSLSSCGVACLRLCSEREAKEKLRARNKSVGGRRVRTVGHVLTHICKRSIHVVGMRIKYVIYYICIFMTGSFKKGPKMFFIIFSVGHTVGFLASSPFQITRTRLKPTFFHEVMASRVSWLFFFLPSSCTLPFEKILLEVFLGKNSRPSVSR
jgi:hypothetical protein